MQRDADRVDAHRGQAGDEYLREPLRRRESGQGRRAAGSGTGDVPIGVGRMIGGLDGQAGELISAGYRIKRVTGGAGQLAYGAGKLQGC